MRPAALIDEVVDWWFACAPSLAIETRVVVPLPRSWTKTSAVLLVSPATRSAAVDEKVTEVPSLLTAGYCAAPMPCVPSLATDTRVRGPHSGRAGTRHPWRWCRRGRGSTPRPEGHVASVAADRRRVGRTVSLGPVAGDRDACGRPCVQVVDENTSVQ